MSQSPKYWRCSWGSTHRVSWVLLVDERFSVVVGEREKDEVKNSKWDMADVAPGSLRMLLKHVHDRQTNGRLERTRLPLLHHAVSHQHRCGFFVVRVSVSVRRRPLLHVT